MCNKLAFILAGSLLLLVEGTSTAQVRSAVKQVETPFITLNFAVKDQVSSILIDTSYKNFKQKARYPVSVFINVNTLYHDKNGFPTPAEAIVFRQLENDLLTALKEYKTCYIGKTMMNGYRDIIFYITKSDQPHISNSIGAVKRKYSRLRSYTFEEDPRWEAVQEFYKGM